MPADISIPCSICGAITEKSFAWIDANNQFVCDCGAIVILELHFQCGEADGEFALNLERAC